MGMDNGEQDGRYVGRYAAQFSRGGAASRLHQMENFYRHFARMDDDLGGKMMALNSLYYPHYYARTGRYTALAAETAQGLPNANLFYAFLRGAAKQFAALIWGNVSIYNRFGFKTCTAHGCSADGTSLSLLKRLMYAQLIYGVSIFGYEGAIVDGEWNLTPIGKMQKLAASMPQWSAAAKMPQCVFTPTVAVVLDVESGWTPPRHLYSSDAYRVWGNLPFDRVRLFHPRHFFSFVPWVRG